MRATRQVRVTCTSAKQVCRIFLYHGAGAAHLPRSNCVSWACVARNTPPERSKPLSGENLIYQVRELRRNLLRSCAVPVGSRNFVPRPLAVEPPTGEKNMRATRPHTPRQVRVTCTPANKFAVFLKYPGAGALHLPRSNCVSWSCVARNPPPERSNPLCGENLIYQVRELRRNSLW